MQAHPKIINSLARVYQNKNVAEHTKKNLKELEILIENEIAKNNINNLLGQATLSWIRKKI